MAADFYSILDNFKNFIGGRTGLFHWCLFCLAVFPGKKISGRETDRPVSGMADNPGTVIFI